MFSAWGKKWLFYVVRGGTEILFGWNWNENDEGKGTKERNSVRVTGRSSQCGERGEMFDCSYSCVGDQGWFLSCLWGLQMRVGLPAFPGHSGISMLCPGLHCYTLGFFPSLLSWLKREGEIFLHWLNSSLPLFLQQDLVSFRGSFFAVSLGCSIPRFKALRLSQHHKIIECPELEGAHKDEVQGNLEVKL